MIQSAMIIIFQCLPLSLYISGRKPDNLLPRIPYSFDYFKSRVVGKLLRQIHNNNNQLVLFKFSFLYWPQGPFITLYGGGGCGRILGGITRIFLFVAKRVYLFEINQRVL